MSFLEKIGVIPSQDESIEKGSVFKESSSSNTDECTIKNVSRRNFIKGVGIASTSMVIGVQFSPRTFAASSSDEFSPDVFISMDKKGTVTVISHRSEMGQGIRSSLPLLIADEMECDWDRVVVEQAIGDAKYGSQNTDGSRSVRRFYFRLKQAGAAARTMLQQAAAQVWKVQPEDVTIYNHQAKLNNSDKVLDFAQLGEIAATLPIPDKSKLTLKTEAEHRYVGKENMDNLDGKGIVTGTAIFGFDVEVPNMKYAVIARPPVVFGKVKSLDDSEALKVPGVIKIVTMPPLSPPAVFNMLGGVAVIAENTWAAIEGRKKLKIEWEHGANASYNTRAHEAVFKKALDNPPHVIRNRGDWDNAKSSADKVITQDYVVGGLAHATMEPPAATAIVNDKGVDVWTCTQTPQSAQRSAMGVMKYPKERANDVDIHVTLLGGGFGRKSKPDYIAEAVFLANETKMPVKVQWTREDEIKHGYYHSPSYQRLSATFDKENNATGWYHSMVNHPIAATFNPNAKQAGSAELGQGDVPFDLPNIKVLNGESDTFMRIGWVRSVTNINNAFAACSFADEMAFEAGKDPKEYLLQLIGKDQHVDLMKDGFKYGNYGEKPDVYPVDTARLKNVIELVAKKAGWGKKLAKGHGMGIAAHRSFCGYIATVVEVSSNNGKIKLENITYAVDSGKIINPDRVRSQMEGAAIFSTSIAFYGEITADKGIIEQSNFHDYEMARMSQIPNIDVHIVKSEEPPAGVGEPGVPPFAPALCNAIFAATGIRYRRLPLKQFGIV
jgi:isoquinoline 1-oxidoreductase beta subunit